MPERVKDQIRLHIRRFPAYESHYGRSSGDPTRLYLSSDLSISKMYSLFIQDQRDNQQEECEEWAYSNIFKTEFKNLRIMGLKSDTCDTCDRLASRIKDGTEDEIVRLEAEREWHHQLGKLYKIMSPIGINSHSYSYICTFGFIEKDAYQAYSADKARAATDNEHVVLTVDLQQVLFTPGVQNNSSFYLRKLSNYNLCITNANDGSSTMNLWNEVQGNRGSNEVSSIIYKYVTGRFARDGLNRKLVIWFDRCVGQNNNTIVLSLMMKLVRQGYFSTMEQRFFVTGHSFNDCDRKFGMIEKKKRKTTLEIPSDIVNLVEE